MSVFDECCGSTPLDRRMAGVTLRRVIRRAQRQVDRGTPPTGIHRDIAELRNCLPEPDDGYEPDYSPPYETDVERQRRNLAQFRDVRDLVRSYDMGNVSWQTEQWGPSPDDPRCLIPWDILKEARS